MATTIASWQDLRHGEVQVLAAIRAAPYGAHRFIADPVRFLHDIGFTVGPAFADELSALPGVRANPKAAYDEIVAGRHPFCQRSISISGLGLPPGLGEKRS